MRDTVMERTRWAALAAAALVPRVVGAVVRRPWHDEYFTAWTTTLRLRDVVPALRLDSGPPLPYLLAKLLAGIGIEPIAAGRAVSVAAGTAAVLLAALAARRAFGARAGWWAGALLAVHPLAVAWSCEARAYALLLLAVAWAWERFEALAGSGRGAVGLAFAVALACWSHGLGMLLAPVLGLAALGLPRPQRVRALSAVGAGLASHLAWLPVALRQPPAALGWMTAAWRTMSFPDQLAAPLRTLSPVAAYGAALDLPSSPAVVEALGALALVALAVTALRNRAALGLATGFAAPVLALGVLAFLGAPAYYPGRGDVLALMPLLALAGATAAGRRWGAVAAAALACAAAANLARSEAAWARTPERGEERIAATLRSTMPQGGLVVIGGYGRLGVEYHLRGATNAYQILNYPAAAGRHPGWYEPSADRPAPAELDQLRQLASGVRIAVAVVAARGLDTEADLTRLSASLGLRPALALAENTVFVSPGGSVRLLAP